MRRRCALGWAAGLVMIVLVASAAGAQAPVVANIYLLPANARPLGLVASQIEYSVDGGVFSIRGARSQEAEGWFGGREVVTYNQLGQKEIHVVDKPLATAEARLTAEAAQTININWPDDSPRFYLEQEGQGLFRRIELVDKEGFSITLRRTGAGGDPKVEIEAARRQFRGGRYDETIRAFVGKPTLERTVCTATAPLDPGASTVVYWQLPRPQPVPDWAVGTWELTGPEGGKGSQLIVKDSGSAKVKLGETMFAGWVGKEGWLALRGTDPKTGVEVQLQGKLLQGGTGPVFTSTPGGETRVTWTATRTQPLANPAKEPDNQGEDLNERGGGIRGGGVGGGLGGGLGWGRSDEPSALAIVLTPETAAVKPPGAAVGGAPPAGPQEALVDVSMAICELTVGSPEWERLSANLDPARGLQQLIAGGKVTPTSQPRLVIQTNRRGVIEWSTHLPYVAWDPQKKGFVQEQVEVGDHIAVTPRILAGGRVSLALEVNTGQLADWAQGPDGSRVPLVTSQALRANVTTKDGQPVVIEGIERLYRTTGDDGVRKTENREVMILITPRILGAEGGKAGEH